MQKTTFKQIWSIVTTVLVVLVVLLAVLLVGVRLVGLKTYAVISGSMEPEYPVGSLLYVKDIQPQDVRVGDVITFALQHETPATHRVIRIDEANRLFYTKGDANDAADAPVHFNNLIGTPIAKIPYLGYAAVYIQHPPGLYVAIGVGAILLILVFLPDVFYKEKPPKQTDSPTDGDTTTG